MFSCFLILSSVHILNSNRAEAVRALRKECLWARLSIRTRLVYSNKYKRYLKLSIYVFEHLRNRAMHSLGVCVCVSVCAHVCMRALASAYSGHAVESRGQRWRRVFFNLSAPYLLRQDLSPFLGSPTELDWLSSKSRGLRVLTSPVLEFSTRALVPGFLVLRIYFKLV